MFSFPLECQNYQTLSTEGRKNTYISSQTAEGITGCDNNLGPAWFPFQGAAGTQMATSCVQPYSCGTHSTGWLNGAHPTVNEGQVTRPTASAGAATAALGPSILKCVTVAISIFITSIRLHRSTRAIFATVALIELTRAIFATCSSDWL